MQYQKSCKEYLNILYFNAKGNFLDIRGYIFPENHAV